MKQSTYTGVAAAWEGEGMDLGQLYWASDIIRLFQAPGREKYEIRVTSAAYNADLR